VSELLTYRGETDGTSTTGTFSLSSEMVVGTVEYVVVPKGMKAKIWAKRLVGKPLDMVVEVTRNISSPTWAEVGRERLVSEGELSLQKRRPMVVRGLTGLDAFRLRWDQSGFGAGKSYVEVEVEFVEE